MSLLDGIENLGQEAVNGFTSLGGLLGIGQPKTSPLLATPQVQSQDLPSINQPQPAAPAAPPAQQGFVSTLLANPALADALGRMSGNLAEASVKGYNTGAGLGYGFSGFNQGWDDYGNRKAALAKTGADTNLANAQAGLATAQGQVAKLKQGLPEQGDSVEAGAVNRQYAYYVSQGMSPHDAFVKAYNEAGLKPQVTPGGAVITPNPLPNGQGAAPGMTAQPMTGAPVPQGAAPAGQPQPALAATPTPQVQGGPALNPIQQANASNKYGEAAAGNQASQINDQLSSAQKDYANAKQALGALQNARSLVGQTFDATGGSPELKAKVSGFFGANKPQVAATDSYQANINTALGPVLRMQDAGPNGQFRMLQGEISNGMKTLGDPDSPHASKYAVLDPNIDRLQASMGLAAYKSQMAQQGVYVTPAMEKDFLQKTGINPATMLPAGKTAASYLPQAPAQTGGLQSAIAAEMKRRGL